MTRQSSARYDSKTNFLNVIFRALSLLGENDKKRAYLVICIYALLGILDLFAALIFGLVGSITVNGLASNEPGNRVGQVLNIIGIGDLEVERQIVILGLSASVILVAKSIGSMYLSKKALFFLSRRSAYLSKTLIDRLFSSDLLSVKQNTLQKTIFSLTSGVQAITAGILGASLVLVADAFLILIFVISFFFVDLTIAISSLILFMSVSLSLHFFMHRRAKILGEEATNRGIESNDRIFEAVSCYRELFVKDRRNFYAEKIGKLQLGMAESLANMSYMSLISKYVIEVTIVVGALFIGFIQFIFHPAPRAIAIISVFMVASARIAPAILRIQTGILQIRNSIGTARPTLDLIESFLPSNTRGSSLRQNGNVETYLSEEKFTPTVKIKNLSFRYPGKSQEILHDLDFEVKAGEFVAIMGASGVGKTTLVDILLGILNPTDGQVLISGLDPLSAISRWPGSIAYVPQETSLVNGSIKANVCLGFDPDEIDDAKVEQLLRFVHLEEILDISQGIHTQLVEGGNSLSGGQKQRIGIARALMTNPKLLVLDESTSGLDLQTEKAVLEELQLLKGNLTIILISHRFSSLEICDKIYRMEAGLLAISSN